MASTVMTAYGCCGPGSRRIRAERSFQTNSSVVQAGRGNGRSNERKIIQVLRRNEEPFEVKVLNYREGRDYFFEIRRVKLVKPFWKKARLAQLPWEEMKAVTEKKPLTMTLRIAEECLRFGAGDGYERVHGTAGKGVNHPYIDDDGAVQKGFNPGFRDIQISMDTEMAAYRLHHSFTRQAIRMSLGMHTGRERANISNIWCSSSGAFSPQLHSRELGTGTPSKHEEIAKNCTATAVYRQHISDAVLDRSNVEFAKDVEPVRWADLNGETGIKDVDERKGQ
ncbi:hypothetical protein C8R43DRAFT_950166 [Mycena crocata]|nr:hypothetical protein C8R43DRAFT_950166 [Mycena crocata]